MTTMTGTVRLDGEARWQAKSGTGHELTIDGPADHGGQNAGFRAMELMLLSLGGCLGGAMLHVLRRMRQDVTGYEIKLEGVRDDQPPTVYRNVTLHHTITGRNVDEAAVKKALDFVEDKYCPASITVASTAKLLHEIHIVGDTAGVLTDA